MQNVDISAAITLQNMYKFVYAKLIFFFVDMITKLRKIPQASTKSPYPMSSDAKLELKLKSNTQRV
jgi:hypothetical protein